MKVFEPLILIADDDAAFAATLLDLFAGRGLSPRWVRDGSEAVDQLRDQPVHLLITDFHMPRLNGFGVLREARRVCAVMPPTILLSANVDDFYEVAGRDSDVVDRVLPKPVRLSRLAETVRGLLWTAYSWQEPGPSEDD